MKKFSNFKFIKLNEQEITLGSSQEEPKEEKRNTEEKQESSLETNTSDKDIKLFSKLFESSEMSRVYHLQASNEGSYAAHKALNEYYNTVSELTDELIETYSGQYGIVEGYETIDTSDTKTKDRLQYFEDLAKFVSESRYVSLSKEDTHLQSLVDEISCLIYRTIYKLKFLK
jgi:hypothetical protein